MIRNISRKMSGRASQRFAELVAAEAVRRGQKPYRLEREQGLPADSLRTVVNKMSVPSIDRVQEICDALGFELYIGPPRDRPGQTISLAGDDFASVPLYAPTASAGPGDVVEGETATAQFAFRLAWMRNRGIAPDHAALFLVRGDSMAPTIPDQAIILVDRSAREPRDRRVYLVRQGEALYIKRLRYDPSGAVIATSDNPAGDAFTLDPSAGERPVLGQVRWSFRTVDDAPRLGQI